MKTNTVRMNWLIPLLGIVLVGGTYAAARSYLGFEQEISNETQLEATLDHIDQACGLLRIQTQLQDGGCPGAARRLDECLSASVVTLDGELASPDERTRGVLRVFFGYMARQQSQHSPMAASLPADTSVTEMGAQKILAQAVADASPGK